MASGVPDDGGFRRSEERRRNRIEESEERVDLVTPCDCERTADSRKRIYDSLCKLVDTRAGALAFMDRYIDRTEGRPGPKGQPLTPHRSKFVFTTKDGQEIEMLPSRPEEAARAAAPSTLTARTR